MKLNIIQFHFDEGGNLYVLTQEGKLYRREIFDEHVPGTEKTRRAGVRFIQIMLEDKVTEYEGPDPLPF